MPRFVVGYTTREIMLLEFSSSIMCLILAGKVGSNIASEIGTMRVTQQIDALEIMGVNSAGYLILPKIIALMTMIPFLVIFSIFSGIIGAFCTCWFGGVMNAEDLAYGLQYSFQEWFVWCSFIKSILFDSLTVLENVMFPLDMFSNDTYRDRVKRAQFCLDRVNLMEAQNKYPGEISGGMQKRVAIARAIALNPQYLFCDEPNSGLDPKTSLVIDELIHDITTEYNMTTIINTHDMNSVMGIGDSILYIYQGHKEWEGTKDDVFTATNERLNNFIFASDLLRKVREVEEHRK